ncbi:hypothetical protein J2T03_001048 [Chryseobacterium lathyri]|nr:hypothetical protein [Chryseobacterium lathyri]
MNKKIIIIVYIVIALIVLFLDIFFKILNDSTRKLFMIITVFVSIITAVNNYKKK